MKIGLVGLGKMGSNMAKRLMEHGHAVVGYALSEESRQAHLENGGIEASSLINLVEQLDQPRVVWVMVPAGDVTEQTIMELGGMLDSGDILIDGGNSNYKDSIRRAGLLGQKGIHFLDVGTSGGIWGLSEGYSIMVGGDEKIVEKIRPIFEALAPGPETGWGRVGPNGAGHFVKMIHNGIEYGMMQAYAEGFEILHAKKEFGLDLEQIFGNLAIWVGSAFLASGSDCQWFERRPEPPYTSNPGLLILGKDAGLFRKPLIWIFLPR